MDFNYDFSKNLGKEMKIRKIDEKPEEVPKESSKTEEPSQSLRIPTRRKVTADSTTINAFINRALMEGQVDKPVVTEKEKPQRQVVNEDENNPFAKVNVAEKITVDETANNIFAEVDNTNTIEKNTGIDREGGDSQGFHHLVELWYQNAATLDYETKMLRIDEIITAAERGGLTTEAATWRCYRFILRNNYLKEKYNTYLQLLAGNGGYENYQHYVNLVQNNPDLGWYENLGWNQQYWEVSTSIMSPGDQEDWNVFHDEAHMGGEFIQLIPNEPAFEYIPADPEQAYVYCVAMIARYSTKILAMQVKLHDPDVINNHVLTEKLNKDIAYYRQLLQGMITERNRLAVELNYATQDENGLIHFNETFPDSGLPMVGGLVPGLTPPENNQPANQQTAQQNFEEMEAKYNANYGNSTHVIDPKQITMLNDMITYATNMFNAHVEPNAAYWQGKIEYWQDVLAQL